MTQALKLLDDDQALHPSEAVALLKKIAYANFDETVEVHCRLGIDPRQADQTVRSTVVAAARHRQGRACPRVRRW